MTVLGFTFSSMTLSAGQTDWEKHGWLGKTVRLLRGGDGQIASQELENYLKLPKQKIVELLLADSHFGDTVLDFNLFFLGGKTDRIRPRGDTYDPAIYDFPQAILSAKEVVKNGDYLKLLDLDVPRYFGPLGGADPRAPEETQMTSEQLRALKFGRIQAQVREWVSLLKNSAHPDVKDICFQFSRHIMDAETWFSSGLPFYFTHWLLKGDAGTWYGRGVVACQSGTASAKELVTIFEKILALNEDFFLKLKAFEPSGYAPTTLDEIAVLDLRSLGLSDRLLALSGTLRYQLQNSSTNLDRRRAAYFLSRYFCDDLTPINVTVPADHAKGRHGTDPSCFACHYKLDPMAGFFRNYGDFFKDYSDQPFIAFDDGVRVTRKSYEDNWRSANTSNAGNVPGASKRVWDVGYVRQADEKNCDPKKQLCNEYGQGIDDLYRILKKAPEVKKCMVNRLFQYLVDPGQAMDAGYLDYLTDSFTKQAEANSAIAFKNLVSEIVLSKAFGEPRRVHDTCYDEPPGGHRANSPPCKVAFVLEKNCTSCHGTSSHFGGLDLSQWTRLADGTFDFKHLDSAGQQKSRTETLNLILDRLTTSDLGRRMPLGATMSSSNREQLVFWVNAELDHK